MNISFDASGLTENFSDGLTQQFYGRQDFIVTTQDLLDVCGAMDSNALLAAGLGLVAVLGFLVYLRRFRDKCSEKQRIGIDKGVLVFVALMFVTVIVRVLRGG